jgi:hypothetical protein
MKRTSNAVFLIALAAIGSVMAADFVHPRLKQKEMMIQSVVMLPPVVDMTQSGVKGSQGMGKEAEQAITDFSSGVSSALVDRGIKVETPFTEQALGGNDELRYAVADVQKRFDEIANQLYAKHKDVRKGRFSLGDSVAVLNTSGTADALVIVRAVGQKQTRAKAFMTGGLLGSALAGSAVFQSRVAFVDAKNGDILFLGDYISRGLPKDKTYEKSFQNIPAGK